MTIMTDKKDDGICVRKPIMYIYNMSGEVQNMSIDFKTCKVLDSVPKIRKDNKLIFSLDTENFINNKYGYLYYEFALDQDITRSNSYVFIRNDRNLSSDLNKLANICSLFGEEARDFVTYWDLELKRSDTPYYKCEIYDEDKLSKLFPMDIDPEPNFLIRRYIKFLPVDKLGKSNTEALKAKWKSRMGNIRVIEWGGWIDESKSIK